MSKQCSRCKLDKDTSEFNRLHCAPDGLQYLCRACQSFAYKITREKTLETYRAKGRADYYRHHERYRKHRVATQAHRNAISRKWRHANPERQNQYPKTFRTRPSGKAKVEHDSLMRRYQEHGVTLDQYHARAEAQDFVCAICQEPPVPKVGRGGSPDGFKIDHDHKTGRFRGLLCNTCNVGIGMLKDSPVVLRSAISYLTSN